MDKPNPLVELGRRYQKSFADMSPVAMPADKRTPYSDWLEANPDYAPQFNVRMESAIKWVESNPAKFKKMIRDFDSAVEFLNKSDTNVDGKIFPNIDGYIKSRAENSTLPLISSEPKSEEKIEAAIVDSAQRLRLGETIKPEDGQWYSYHLFVKSDEGMVAASLVDLYENYIRALGLYPEGSGIEAVVANALTEAAYLTNPEGELFKILKDPKDEWIYGFPGFSSEFQKMLYGDSTSETEQ